MIRLFQQSNRTERTLFIGNIALALINIAAPLAFPDLPLAALNWFIAGACIASAGGLMSVISRRIMIDDLIVTIDAQQAFIEKMLSSEHHDTMIRQAFERAQRDGLIPPNIGLMISDPKPKLH